MVWLLPGANTSQVAIILIITYFITLGELAHIVAGSVDVFYAIVTGATSWGAYLRNFMLPTLLGNIVGWSGPRCCA